MWFGAGRNGLMWIDLGRYIKPEDMKHVIQDKCGLAVDYGSWLVKDMTDLSASILQTSKENIELAAQNNQAPKRLIKDRVTLADMENIKINPIVFFV